MPTRRSASKRYCSISAAVGSMSAWPARRRASAALRSWTTCRTIGMAPGVMLNSVSPRPTSRPTSAGSEAISPQSDTGMWCRVAARRTRRMQPQDRRVQRLVQIGHPIVGAVHGQRVLDEIVGADGEEVHLGGQQVRRQRGRRHLDHRADREARGGVDVARDLIEDRASLAHLLHRGHEGKHHAEGPVRGRADQGAQLRPQHLGMGEAEPQAAEPGPRPSALGTMRGAELALVEVEGPDRDRPRRDLLDQAPVQRVLRILGGRVERASGEHELGAIEPHAFGAVLVEERQILEQLDVGLEADAHAVGRRYRVRRPARALPRPRRRGFDARRCAPSICSAVGATVNSPVVPSRITGVPAAMRIDASCSPTMAGTFSERARIAV